MTKSKTDLKLESKAEQSPVRSAFRAAFPYTIPIMAGFLFLGIAYGVYMNLSGFSPIYPILMTIVIFGGSMEFIAVGLLLSRFDPLGTLILTLMVHARHIFYGISMLEKYKGLGWKKIYLIYAMCDESFSINCTTQVPEGVDRGWFYVFVTFLNQIYWVGGATLGAIFGTFLNVEVKGLDFVMTALLVVIFLDNWLKEKEHTGSVVGVAATATCLVLFGSSRFLIPSMAGILIVLAALRPRLEPKVDRLAADEPGSAAEPAAARNKEEEA